MGKLEYRTYYNNVTNPGFDVNSRKFSIQPKLRKPIIILDGFDPGDGRKIYEMSVGYDTDKKSIYELMFYDHDKDLNTRPENLVQELQSKGFDVTLVNFQNGADFIERNAMALVALLQKENAKLITNGSAEKVSIIGPSMGGLISRYALAYMEKNGIPHNTKLWVSFDSPHLGANIPISVQASLFFLGTVGGSLEASNKFVENFMSPAARQMLIEQMDGYPNNTTFSSSNKNNTHPFRQQFLQNQITNSLPNSNGFPTLTRNIALINGTTNGTKNNLEGASILDVAAFATFNLKAFYLVLKNLGAPNSSIRTFDGRFTTKKPCKIVFTNMTFGICNIDIITWRRTEVNINPRGSMDVVQGGTFNTQGDIKKSLDDNAELQSLNVENRLIAPDHSFIPSVSALAFKNPNFNWAVPLNRNLVCNPNNKEIYFDSYFAAPANEEHVKISADGAKWLVKELEGIPQAPSFPIEDLALTGPTNVCLNSNVTYNFNDLCKIPSTASWSLSSNLQIISQTPISITVNATASGQAFINAIFSNGQIFTKSIFIPSPVVYTETIRSTHCKYDLKAENPFNDGVYQNVSWQYLNGTGNAEASNFYPLAHTAQFFVCPPFSASLLVTATNSCGVILTNTVFLTVNNDNEEPFRTALQSTQTENANNYFKIYPNPSKKDVNIELINDKRTPKKDDKITCELYNMIGLKQRNIKILSNKAQVEVNGLPKGIYILKIYINDTVENHQIGVE